MGPVNILMVDDQPAKLLAYEAMLGELGENLIKANTAREALAALLQHEIAVILMDVSMPEIDGFELAALVRQHPRCQRTAIIFVSAIHLSDLDKVKGYEAGAVDYVSVPVIPEILRAKIRVFIELHRKTIELKQLNDELEARVRSRTNDLEASLERLHESETRLRLQGEALVDAGRRKDEFLAMLGHELRNPLAPIRNAVELIRRAPDRSPALESISDVVDRQVAHLARLVDDLLDASRISRGKMMLSRTTVELNRLVTEAVESVRPMDVEGHSLVVSTAQTPIYVDADPVRLTQVLVNLLGNAVKFTPKAGKIEVTVVASTDQVVITVEDSGQGIESADLGRIFEMFYQGRAATGRDRGGLGLGLTLVRTLVEMHDGTVAVDSGGHERGSRFVVCLPRIASAMQMEPHNAPPLVASARSRRVLVVDDNRDAAESLAMLLRIEGAEVEVAFDGEAAVRTAAQFRPDVVLLDIGLPKMDGYTAARTIRRDPSGQGVLLVAMTGWGQADDKRRAMEAGFDAHLVKPVSMDTLMDIFASVRQPAKAVADTPVFRWLMVANLFTPGELSSPSATGQSGQSLAALARACAAPKASVLALLTGMLALGYLIRDRDGYRAGPRLQTLALRQSAGLDFAQVAQPIMAALVDATGETVLLGVATSRGEQVSYIAKVESSNPVRYTVSLNERRELYCAATGKIVLAWKSPVEVAAYLRKRRLIAFTPHTRTKPSQLMKEVADIRERRLAETREELVLGAYALAVPVINHTGTLVAALTLAGPVSRISAHRRTLIPQLRRSGEALDALLREFPDLQIPRVT